MRVIGAVGVAALAIAVLLTAQRAVMTYLAFIYYGVFFALFLATGLVPYGKKRRWPGNVYLAFMVTLYTEMLGLPLTLYLLSWFFGPQIADSYPVVSYLWRPVIGWFIPALDLLSVSITIVGLVLLFVGWQQIFSAHQRQNLLASGLYAWVRHPQYLGILFFITGMVLQYPTLLVVTMYVVLFVLYYRLAKREEQGMLDRYGEHYAEYMRRVPMFIPRSLPEGFSLGQGALSGARILIVTGTIPIFAVWFTNSFLTYVGLGQYFWPFWSILVYRWVFDIHAWEAIIFASLITITVGLGLERIRLKRISRTRQDSRVSSNETGNT